MMFTNFQLWNRTILKGLLIDENTDKQTARKVTR